MATAVAIKIEAKEAAAELKLLANAFGTFSKQADKFGASVAALKKISGMQSLGKTLGLGQMAKAADALKILERAINTMTPQMQKLQGSAVNVGDAQTRMADALRRAGVDVEKIVPVMNRAGDAVTKFNVTVDKSKDVTVTMAQLRKAMNEGGLAAVALAVNAGRASQSMTLLAQDQAKARDASNQLGGILKRLGVDVDTVKVGMNNAGTAIRNVNLVLKGQGDAIAIQRQVTAELNRMGQSAHTVSVRFKEAKKDTDGFSLGLGGLKTKLLGVAASLAGGFGLVQATKSIVEARIQFQRIENTLFSATGSLRLAREEFAYVSQISERLGLDLGSLAGQFARFTAAAQFGGLSANEARTAFEGVAQAATVLQLSGADTFGVIKALEQIISKGTVSAEELRGQLGDRLPGAFLIAARAMQEPGQSIEESVVALRKMLDLGTLTSQEFIQKFGPAMQEAFGGAALVSAQNSLFSNLTRLKNDALITFGAIGKGAEKGFTDVIKSIRSLLVVVKEAGPAVGKALGSLSTFFSLLVRNIRVLTAAALLLASVLAVKLVTALAATATTASIASGVLGALAAKVLILSKAVVFVAGLFTGFALAVAAVVTAGVALKLGIDYWSQSMTESMAKTIGASNDMLESWINLQDVLKAGTREDVAGRFELMKQQLSDAKLELDATVTKIKEAGGEIKKIGDLYFVVGGKVDDELLLELGLVQDVAVRSERELALLERRLGTLNEAQKAAEVSSDALKKSLESLGSAGNSTAYGDLSTALGAVQSQLKDLAEKGMSEADKATSDWKSNIKTLADEISNYKRSITETRLNLAKYNLAVEKAGLEGEELVKAQEQQEEATLQLIGTRKLLTEAEIAHQRALAQTPKFLASLNEERKKLLTSIDSHIALLHKEAQAISQGANAYTKWQNQQKITNELLKQEEELREAGLAPMARFIKLLELLAGLKAVQNASDVEAAKLRIKDLKSLKDQTTANNNLANAMMSGSGELKRFQDEMRITAETSDFLRNALERLGDGGEEEAHRLAEAYKESLQNLAAAEEFKRQVDEVSGYIASQFSTMFRELIEDGEINWERLGDSLLDIMFQAFEEILQQWIETLILMAAAEEGANLGDSDVSMGSSGSTSTLGSAAKLAGGWGALASYAAAIVGVAAILWVFYKVIFESSDYLEKSFRHVADVSYHVGGALEGVASALGGAASELVAAFDMVTIMLNDRGHAQVQVAGEYLTTEKGKFTFETLEEATEAALLEVFRHMGESARYVLTENVRKILQTFDELGITTLDQLQAALEVAQKIDSVGKSSVALALDELFANLATFEMQVKGLGLSIDDLNAYRAEELRLIKETADAALNQLIPGFSTLPAQLAEAVQGLADFSTAVEDMGGVISSVPPIEGVPDGGIPGPERPIPENKIIEWMGEAERAFGLLGNTFKEMDGEGDNVSKSAGEASKAMGEVSNSMTETARLIEDMVQNVADLNEELTETDLGRIRDAITSVTAQLTTSLGENILQYIDNEEIRRQVEHANHILRIMELRMQLEALRALGTVSMAVLNLFENAIDQIEGMDPSSFNFGGGGGSSANSGSHGGVQGRQDRRRELQAMYEDMLRVVSGVSDVVLEIERFKLESEALAEEMRLLSTFSEEFIEEFIRLREEIKRGEILEPFEDIIKYAGMSDTEKAMAKIQEEADAATEALILLGASEEELAIVSEAVAIQMEAVREAFRETVDEFVAAQKGQLFSVVGITDFAGALADLTKEFNDAKAEAELLGESTEDLTAGFKMGQQAIALGFLQSLQAMGVEIPGLGLAILALQRAMVLAQIAALAANQVFLDALEAMGTTLPEIIAAINAAFDHAEEILLNPPAPPPGTGGGGGGTYQEPPWLKYLEDIEAYILRAQDLSLSPLERELVGIQREFQELYDAAKAAGVGMNDLNRLTAAYQLFLDDFWRRAYEPVVDALAELRNTDPSNTQVENFQLLRERFLDAVARARGGDLGAIEEAAQLGIQLRDLGGDFFGTSTGAFQNLMGMIEGQLEGLLPEGYMDDTLDKDETRNNLLTDIRDLLSTGFGIEIPGAEALVGSLQQQNAELSLLTEGLNTSRLLANSASLLTSNFVPTVSREEILSDIREALREKPKSQPGERPTWSYAQDVREDRKIQLLEQQAAQNERIRQENAELRAEIARMSSRLERAISNLETAGRR